MRKIIFFLVFLCTYPVFCVNSFFEPREINIFRKAYSDVVFVSKYDKDEKDWLVKVTVENRIGIFYWADGRLLPKEEMSHKDDFSSLLYEYPEELPNPENFSEEDILRIREYSSPKNRKNGLITSPFLYDLIYDCKTRASVEKHIIKMSFLGRRVNLHENLKEPLEKIDKEIKRIAERDEEVNSFCKKISQTDGYYWRAIRDSNNKSNHSIGIAIDILPTGWGQKNIYWGWRRDLDPDNWMKLPLDRRWMPPEKVIEVFEKYGFIWGGKWIIWDNMHFEYRPELLVKLFPDF